MTRSGYLAIDELKEAGCSVLPTPGTADRGAAWLVGAALTLTLSLLFMLMTPSGMLLLLSLLLLTGWGLLAWRHPLPAFTCLVGAWVTVYPRASLPLFQVEGGWNRGGIGLGDMLWLIFIGVWLVHEILVERWRPALPHERFDTLLLLLTPYLVLSVLLPIAGVLIGGYPLSYITPGLRHLQWASFALLGYWLCLRYGLMQVAWITLLAFTAAGVVHALYALIQLLAPLGVLPSVWLLPDQVFAQRFTTTWFFYPRTTGLLANPNGYGLFGSVALLLLSAALLSGMRVELGMKGLLGLTGLWAIATSASRSAIGGLVTALLLMGGAFLLKVLTHRDEKSLKQFAGLLLKTLLALVIATGLADVLLPSHLLSRVVLLVEVVTKGAAADPNAIGRFELWEGALRTYENLFPWGTWVPAGYALDTPIDSYYVSLLVQGTPLYLLTFLGLLLGMLRRGWLLLSAGWKPRTWTGLALIGIGGLTGIASLTLSPVLQPEILTPFWLLVGMGLARRP